MKMTGNTILVTGATSGIGKALAEAFHALGNTVIVAGRRQSLLEEIVAANPGMEAVTLDVGDRGSIASATADVTTRFPGLNVLINNAGIMPFDDPAGPIDDAVSQLIVATNLLGPIRMTSALIEQLKSQPHATIINTTSVLAFVPLASNAVYSATKAALHSYSMSQRFALRDTSVRVQEIAPPWVETGLVGSDPRAMPLQAFIAETMSKLASDDEEVIVDSIKDVRDNPGIHEHAMVNGFNQMMVEVPVPIPQAA
ncbi:SDR family NAD(P)-dependent oxidoreductase [Sphingomonadaceae bacterium OTU29LAMAA1]|nr:SDR family NAD(P)-dependent oxidoreductase [Sphingomonadaceae bacterium OTU29LAMAA1]